jgi:hypothetical protein
MFGLPPAFVIVLGAIVVLGLMAVLITVVKRFVLPRSANEREQALGDAHFSDTNAL